MRKLLALLVVLTVACGVAASFTVARAPAYADAGADGDQFRVLTAHSPRRAPAPSRFATRTQPLFADPANE